jgi:hypothetical protein
MLVASFEGLAGNVIAADNSAPSESRGVMVLYVRTHGDRHLQQLNCWGFRAVVAGVCEAVNYKPRYIGGLGRST